jgi:hypothetical protein
MRVGYLISQYPTVSHSFLVREVRELRALGAEIEIASVRNPDRVLSELTAGELEEASRAYYIRADAARWPLFHLQTMGTRSVPRTGIWLGCFAIFGFSEKRWLPANGCALKASITFIRISRRSRPC